MWNLKSDKNPPIYKPETDSQATQRDKLAVAKVEQEQGGKNWRVGLGRQTTLHRVDTQQRSYCAAPRPGNCIQHPMIHNEKKSIRETVKI